MSWSSILPSSMSFVETWVTRIFLLLGFITIGPWLLLLLYDAILYMFRTATYEVPYVGGRARNRLRPRAPSLTERPSGKRRSLSLLMPPAVAGDTTGNKEDGLKRRLESSDMMRDKIGISTD